MLSIKGADDEIKAPTIRPVAYGFIVCAGILLPLITLIVELSTRMCADAFFDPVPSWWHVLAVGFVPLANAWILWSLHRNRLEKTVFLAWISAIAAGAALLYSIIFLPISPLGVFGVLFVGLGLLPLSPFFALAAVILLRKYLLERIDARPSMLTWPGLLGGFLIVLTVIGLSEARFMITGYGLKKASAGNVAEEIAGIEFLRRYGNEDYIVQLAGSQRNRFYISEFVMPGERISAEKAREIYYRMTGKTYEAAAKPVRSFFDDEQFSNEQEISLSASQIETTIDNDAALGYLEWTFALKNANQNRALEGFTQIQLPPGAVVSRLTLWIDGEEREAAFAEKGRVAEAYKAVTAKRRDPVLVTTAGRDRVNLKCFPIPQNGGEMKMRLGITFPLILENERRGIARLPYFRDRNFQVPDSLGHAVRIESKAGLESANQNLKPETNENVFTLRGALTDRELIEPLSAIRAVRSDEFKTVWAKDDNNFIIQRVTEIAGGRPSRFVFVVDTSAAMIAERTKLAAALGNLPEETEISLVLTGGNALNRDIAFPHSFTGKPSEIVEKINRAEFGGGTDNLPALSRAWELAGERPNSAVIWIHAPQPYNFSASDDLARRLTRRPAATNVYSLSTASGLDEVEKRLDGLNFLNSVPRFGDLQSDLERLVAQLDRSVKSFGHERRSVAKLDGGPAKETSKHLSRLWANDEVNRLLDDPNEEQAAVNLAVKYQLVTPVTGAVVLETQAQYDQFGLHPVDKQSVPTIPEPEFYLFLIVILGVLIWLFATRKLF